MKKIKVSLEFTRKYIIGLGFTRKKARYYSETKNYEEKLNENNNTRFNEDYKLRIKEALNELDTKGHIYLKPGPDGLDKLSPKMKTILSACIIKS